MNKVTLTMSKRINKTGILFLLYRIHIQLCLSGHILSYILRLVRSWCAIDTREKVNLYLKFCASEFINSKYEIIWSK